MPSRYNEGIGVLYQSTTFCFNDVQTLSHFFARLPPSLFVKAVRGVKLTLALDNATRGIMSLGLVLNICTGRARNLTVGMPNTEQPNWLIGTANIGGFAVAAIMYRLHQHLLHGAPQMRIFLPESDATHPIAMLLENYHNVIVSFHDSVLEEEEDLV